MRPEHFIARLLLIIFKAQKSFYFILKILSAQVQIDFSPHKYKFKNKFQES